MLYQIPTEVICFYRGLDDSENRRWLVIKDGARYYWENFDFNSWKLIYRDFPPSKRRYVLEVWNLEGREDSSPMCVLTAFRASLKSWSSETMQGENLSDWELSLWMVEQGGKKYRKQTEEISREVGRKEDCIIYGSQRQMFWGGSDHRRSPKFKKDFWKYLYSVSYLKVGLSEPKPH